jgi:hypothetical protein
VREPRPGELHPLLLQREYWRGRLLEQQAIRPFLLLTPRPDLSSASCDVQEIRFRAHDGARIWGLVGRCPLLRSLQPAALRVLNASEVPRIDPKVVELGQTQFVIQMPPGRRLVDRVLDTLRLRQIAAEFAQIDAARVHFAEEGQPDEVRIASELQAGGFLS